MTHRERFVRTMHYQEVDHPPDEEFGYWDDTLTAWHQQGLPEWVTDNGKANRFFGFAPRAGAPVRLGLMPGFESKVLEEDERHQVVQDGSGVTHMVNKDGSSTIPKYLKFPVETREGWEDFKRRLNPVTPGRYPENFKQRMERLAEAEVPVGIGFGSLFGWLRNWMGFENISIACAEDPGWIDDMVEHLCQFIIALIRPVLEFPGVRFDYASGWEDMCFNHGCIISPAMFEKFLVPRYRRITELLHAHGCDVVITDCDGNINDVVHLWLEAGVNCMFPVEVAAGTDPVALRERFGRDILLAGGVNKRELAKDKGAIEREVHRLLPLVEEGGYIPHVDHRVPPDVSYDNYLYYLDCKREVFGIPKPEAYEEPVQS
ncbi:MAG: uroporphyrinogen decarboxylase family protein [Armatimonadota bacterium]